MQLPRRISLASTPTPLEPFDRLGEEWGGPRIWVKRDDLTGFELSGNKVRKLEYHLAAAQDAGASVVITTGAEQSNHCRATALAAARLGLACTLFIRTADGAQPAEISGNHRLHHAAGAEIIYVTPAQYADRDALMAAEAERCAGQGAVAWVIPEGASDALGMWGMATAFAELHEQVAMVRGQVAAVWHASSSAGTTAGLGWMSDRLQSTIPLVATSVGDPADQLESSVHRIWADACAQFGGSTPRPPLEVTDRYIGGGYGVADAGQRAVVDEATRLTGLLFDPTYTGKAIYGLWQAIRSGRYGRGDDVVFWHTGGGFAALV